MIVLDENLAEIPIENELGRFTAKFTRPCHTVKRCSTKTIAYVKIATVIHKTLENIDIGSLADQVHDEISK
jgi:hypothetical protein